MRIAPCSREAARWAVLNWHYSHTMPTAKLVTVGAWEHDEFVGAVVFGWGAAPYLGRRFGVDPKETCELVRVAFKDHEAPISHAVAEALKILKRTNPGIRLVISFADTNQGHVGTIYQAGNWIYTGAVESDILVVHGQRRHVRSIGGRWKGGTSLAWLRAYVDPNAEKLPTPEKHRYVMPLDRAIRRRLLPFAQPYPRGLGLDGEPLASQAGGTGSTPVDRSEETDGAPVSR